VTFNPSNPLIIQSDSTVLLETVGPHYAEVRDALLRFAELVKSPEYVHTWRITPLSLWNAAAAGMTADDVLNTLETWAKFPIPEVVPTRIRTTMERYGRLTLVRDGAWLRLEADDEVLMLELRHLKPLGDVFGEETSPTSQRIHPRSRGELKQVLVHLGHPVRDLAGYDDGDSLDMGLVPHLPGGQPLALRAYQREAVDAFMGRPGEGGGCGVVVLPCGAGKTLVGIGAMVRLGMRTLILCTGNTALRQWKREILEKTTLTEADVGEYTSRAKDVRAVTLTTYQILTWRRDRRSDPPHLKVFHQANWGLIIYDEVHLLPAPVFRETAWLQARRRLGLTATLIREDGLETDVFALVGPKRFDMPWRRLEEQGWIATARCVEVRVALSDTERVRYATASDKDRFRIASTNARKGRAVEVLLERHPGEPTLVIGTYVDQLTWLGRRFGFPVITGRTNAKMREKLYASFKAGEEPVLGLSKVGNFSVDLPDAAVAIQISGTFGSRQEEAQRLGRILRPKADGGDATFYSLVTAESREQEFAERRQLFLTEQGYPYRIEVGG
jgi:DNA excision repair protein ERCC-3